MDERQDLLGIGHGELLSGIDVSSRKDVVRERLVVEEVVRVGSTGVIYTRHWPPIINRRQLIVSWSLSCIQTSSSAHPILKERSTQTPSVTHRL